MRKQTFSDLRKKNGNRTHISFDIIIFPLELIMKASFLGHSPEIWSFAYLCIWLAYLYHGSCFAMLASSIFSEINRKLVDSKENPIETVSYSIFEKHWHRHCQFGSNRNEINWIWIWKKKQISKKNYKCKKY